MGDVHCCYCLSITRKYECKKLRENTIKESRNETPVMYVQEIDDEKYKENNILNGALKANP